jgi:FkbM family methyltransferase
MRSETLRRILLWAKLNILRALLPLGLRPSRRIAGHKLFFDPTTDIGFDLCVTGGFEKGAISQCASFIRADGTVLDVGANIGVHTVHFSEFARFGSVICFEPARSTFEYLLRNVRQLSNVIPLNIALSNESGIRTFYVAADNAYSGLKDTRRKQISYEESIACFKGDDILFALTEGKRIDLVKIDVEGLEMQVLTGMREFVIKNRPVIFCEIYGGQHSNPDPESTIDFCVSLEYDAFVLEGGSLIPAGKHDDKLYNYFFIPRISQIRPDQVI